MNNAEQATINDITIIAHDAHFKGELSFENNLHIFGRFEGQLTTSGKLEVMSEAKVNADIKAGDIIVTGTIQGNLAASGVIELKKTANIRGDIKCERLVMIEGASIEGQCQVGNEST